MNIRHLIGAVVAGIALWTLAFAGVASATGNGGEKVWICHGLPFVASHDYNLIEVSVNAVDGEGLNDHTSHVNREGRFDDIIPAPVGEDGPYCPADEVPPTTTTEVPVTTTVPEVTTTTVETSSTVLVPLAPPTPPAPPAAPVAAPELAFTGLSGPVIGGIALAGALFLMLGAVARRKALNLR